MSLIRNNQYYNTMPKDDTNLLPTHVYLDLDIINNDTTNLSPPPILRFEETRNSPFLTNPQEYFCSIIRFNIQTANSIPVFIPRIQTGQSDINKTVYIVGFSYGSYHTSINVTYECEDLNQPTPQSPEKFQDFSSDYYNVYNYQSFTKQINKALYDGWLLLVNMASIASSTPPVIEFDINLGKFIMLFESAFYNEALNAHITVYFNTRLMQLFQSLPCKFLAYNLVHPSENYSLTVINDSYINMRLVQNLSLGRSVNYIQIYQEVNSLSLWNPVQSIVFSSSMIPVAPTLSSPAKVINDTSNTNLTSSNGNNANLTSVLTDFSLEVSALNAYRPSLSYVPQSEYRLLDLFSSSNLSSVSILVYYKDVFGNLKPLKIEPGCSANMKIMFRRKNFNI